MEEAVRVFPSYHKYALGADLRHQSIVISRILVRALNANGAERAQQVKWLQHAVDDIKVMIQTAKEIQVGSEAYHIDVQPLWACCRC